MSNPLFVADLATLRKELRLTGLDTASDAEAIVERGALTARTGFYTRLGLIRVAEILAITYVADPTTNDQIIRAIANLCEIAWVRLTLMDILPTIFMDASGGDQEFQNEEGTFRSKEIEALAEERTRLLVQIETWLSILSGEQALGDVSMAQFFSQADQTPRMFPGGTLIGRNTRLIGDPTRDIVEGATADDQET